MFFFLLGSFKDMEFEIMTFLDFILFEHKSFKNSQKLFSDF